MSFDRCINEAVVKGLLKEGKAKEALDLYDDLVDELKAKGASEQAAKEAAAKQATETMTAEKAAAKKRALRQAQRRATIQMDMRAYRDQNGIENPMQAAESLYTWNQRSKFSDVVSRSNTIKRLFHSMFEKNLDKYKPRKAGIQQTKAGQDNIVRELFGENTGDTSARELMEEWSNVAETMRLRANRAGAAIAKRDDWNLPQKHDKATMRRMGEDAWVKDIADAVNWDEMQHPVTGRKVFPNEREDVLRKVYKTILTDGHIKGGSKAAKGSLANSLGHERFLVYKDADSWLRTHQKYGKGSVFDVMVNHIDRMSHDIAMMEILGPNPRAMHDAVIQDMKTRAAELATADPKKYAKFTRDAGNTADRMEDYYSLLMGTTHASESTLMASLFGGTRDTITGALLGSTPLVAVSSDLFTTNLTLRFNGLPATKAIKRYIKLIGPQKGAQAQRQLAIRLGVIAESATSQASAFQRYFGDFTGPNITRRVTDTVLRASGLTGHTEVAGWAFTMEMMGHFADNAGKAFDEVPFVDGLKRHGITSEDWDVLRHTPITDVNGAKFLRVFDVLERDGIGEDRLNYVANKFMEYIAREQEFAVPTSSLKARASLVSDTRANTLPGQLARSFANFKNFPVTILFTHMLRGMLEGSYASKGKYLAQFTIGMTVMGGFATQLGQIVNGKDPLDMTKPEFWYRSALKGGGLGIFADFIQSSENRFGGGLTTTAAGATVQFGSDLGQLTIGNVLEALQGKDTKFGAEAVRFLSRYTPGSSLWYARLGLQRYLWDGLTEAVDPEAGQKFRRMERDAKRKYDQEYWWRPGQKAPERVPDLAAAIE